MSRPTRRQVQSYQPPVAPAVYAPVPQASPPRQSRSSLQGTQYQSSVGGPRPVPSSQGHGRSQSSSSNGGHYYAPSQSYGQPRSERRASNERRTSAERRPSRPSSRQSSRNNAAMGVATGQIGTAYGPYSYHTNPAPRNTGVYGNGRFSNAPSDASISTNEYQHQQYQQYQQAQQYQAPPQPPIAQRTTTVPAYMWDKEPDLDDALHAPDPKRDNSWTPFSWRGWVNVFGILVLLSGLLTLFIGFPLIDFVEKSRRAGFTGFNIGGVNASGQIPRLPGMRKPIDPDTPLDAYERTGNDGYKYELVFSDEFNLDGRTFYPGDDPYWEAVDLHYWPTGNLEWYDPQQVTTEDGKLVITFDQRLNHNLSFIGGMVSSWNKICFTTGYIETSVSLPGNPRTSGLWPAVWTMGNLGRAGYGATTEGTWPYSYDTCEEGDLGTFPGQTGKDGSPGRDVLMLGENPLSRLPGQKLSACSCPGSDHPGPRHDIGRAAPEVDIIEAEVLWRRPTGPVGGVSQSCQIAPYDFQYRVNEDGITVHDAAISERNSYMGGPYQQAVSTITDVPTDIYEGEKYTTFGYELWSDPNNRDAGHITWFSDGKPAWTLHPEAIGPNNRTRVGQRIISEEPMYMLFNVGMAPNFQQIQFNDLDYPSRMRVDYVRIYQREGVRDGLTCDPPNRPTADYIQRHLNAYTDWHLTTWEAANNTFPRNRLYDGC
ncbi:beta-glucan synthesis-associated protein [Coprinopsis sp. MPI-PUGE-AT-0042]|nr:beta-glucan synthesis-associated protein [Coprinopsis sp. MPI-PUGE-AT-0042]